MPDDQWVRRILTTGASRHRSPSARTMGRLMMKPETAHIASIRNIMARLLVGLMNEPHTSCQA